MLIGDKSVTALGCHGLWPAHSRAAKYLSHRRFGWNGKVDRHQPGIATNVGMRAMESDAVRTGQNIVRIEDHVAFEEVVERVAIEQRAGCHHDKAFVFVGDINVGIHHVDGSFLVLREMLARGIGGNGCGRCHRSGVAGANKKALANR